MLRIPGGGLQMRLWPSNHLIFRPFFSHRLDWGLPILVPWTSFSLASEEAFNETPARGREAHASTAATVL